MAVKMTKSSRCLWAQLCVIMPGWALAAGAPARPPLVTRLAFHLVSSCLLTTKRCARHILQSKNSTTHSTE